MRKLLVILICFAVAATIVYEGGLLPEKDASMQMAGVDERGAPTGFTLIEEPIVAQKSMDQKKLVYESYDVGTRKVNDKSFVNLKELPDGKKLVRWSIESDDYIHRDHYLLDDDHETITWEIFESDKGTHYAGKREGNKLLIDGVHRGDEVRKTLTIDEKPFYYNPKLGLEEFVESEKDYMEFWALRNDTLEEYLMKAVKKGQETIDLNGETFEVVKVYWAATGIGEKFFKRTYYFRKDDGTFLTQDVSDGWKSDLIIER